MQNITQTVYESLKADTKAIRRAKARRAAVNELIDCGFFKKEVLEEVYYPQRDELTAQIRQRSDLAIKNARELVLQYRKDAEKLNELNVADITDDAKLFNIGVQLTEKDLTEILDRSKDNRTMQQLTHRYAKEHGIFLHGRSFEKENSEEQNTADGLDSVISYYSRWIDTDNAEKMLDRFFNVTDEGNNGEE